jgi:hypothetical protein
MEVTGTKQVTKCVAVHVHFLNHDKTIKPGLKKGDKWLCVTN